MTEREALKLALEALEEINKLSIGERAISLPAEIDTAMDAIKEALAQPEQEPVANYCKECLTYNGHQEGCSQYTTPPQRTWVGLTYEDMVALQKDLYDKNGEFVLPTTLAMAVEAKLKEKNTWSS